MEVRTKRYFICDYTGAPIASRYYVPGPPLNRSKKGAYATLPILLRHQFELLGPGEKFDRLKAEIEEFYQQPNIPMQPAISVDHVPFSREELRAYMGHLEMGEQWLLVDKAQPISEINFPGDKPNRNVKRAKLREAQLEGEAEEVLGLKTDLR